jgi:hypothetical protein
MCLGHQNVLRTVAMTAISFFALAGSCLYSAVLAAGEVVELAIDDKQGVYQLKLEIILDAPFADVHYVITDYAHTYRFNPSIVESQVLDTPDNSAVRLRTLINNCILFFCREVVRVQDMRELGTGDIYAVIVPQLSDVRSGSALWHIQPGGSKTRIRYSMNLEPGFSLPPLIGSYIVKRKLREETLISFNNIERLAQIREQQNTARNSTRSEALPNRAPSGRDSTDCC